ncbi:DUF4214 domain-containing protein [Rugamonas sp.]|uniref:NHL domain-containing protein n=1 Tax=Rugamonas sp. TaxID=1926287 RepID=UPI0025F4A080|nr:DUF4214 domain-containing protein [Rugamonas sp.]
MHSTPYRAVVTSARLTLAATLAAALLLNGCGGGRSGDGASTLQAQAQRLSAAAPAATTSVAIAAPYTDYTIGANGDTTYTVTDHIGTGGAQTYASGTRLVFADQTVELDTDGPAARTYRLYQAAFNRQPDLPGLGFWIDYVDGGAGMVDVAAGFMMSKEFSDLYGANPTPEQLITGLYANVLHRAPEPAGFQFWMAAMATGTTPAQALNYFSDSPENQAQVAAAVANGVAYMPKLQAGVYLVAGDGLSGGDSDGGAGQARFDAPNGLTMDAAGNLYTADSNGNRIRRITPQGQVTTFAGGSNVPAIVDGTGGDARFAAPTSITTDGLGTMYVLDRSGTLIRKLTPAGVVSSYAGCFAPPASPFPLSTSACDPAYPVLPYAAQAILSDANGVLYVLTDIGLAKIDTARKISLQAAPQDQYYHHYTGLALDGVGNVYVSDAGAGLLYRVAPTGGWTVVAGKAGVSNTVDGHGTAARLAAPTAMQFDTDGNLYFVNFNRIRKLSPAGDVSTLAGTAQAGTADGPLAAATFRQPNGLVIDAAHDVYIADTGNNVIRLLSAAGQVSTVAGKAPATVSADGSGMRARFQAVHGLAVDGQGRVLVADASCVRAISTANQVSTVAGSCAVSGAVDGPAASARFGQLSGIAADAAGDIYVSDLMMERVRKITADGAVAYYGGGSYPSIGVKELTEPDGIALGAGGQVFVADAVNNRVVNLGTDGFSLGDVTGYGFPYLTDLAFAPGGTLYAIDAANNLVWLAAPGAKQFQALGNVAWPTSGDADGTLGTAALNGPRSLAVDPAGNVYVADTTNHLIRKITPAGVVTTVAGTRGQSGTRTGALPGGLYQPTAIKVLDMHTLLVNSGNSVLKIVLP